MEVSNQKRSRLEEEDVPLSIDEQPINSAVVSAPNDLFSIVPDELIRKIVKRSVTKESSEPAAFFAMVSRSTLWVFDSLDRIWSRLIIF